MKKYTTPSLEEIKLVSQEQIASSVDGSGSVVSTVPTPPAGGKK